MFCRHLCSTSFAAVAGPGPSRPPPRAAVTAPSARRATIAVVPHSAGKGLVGGPAGGEGAVHPDPSQPLYPGFQEEKDVSHQAFLHAFEAARPRAMSIPGMQVRHTSGAGAGAVTRLAARRPRWCRAACGFFGCWESQSVQLPPLLWLLVIPAAGLLADPGCLAQHGRSSTAPAA
jgi:hypothetical protein